MSTGQLSDLLTLSPSPLHTPSLTYSLALPCLTPVPTPALLSLRRHGERNAPSKWTALASNVQVPFHCTHTLRCPEGCAFRVSPTNLVGWADGWAAHTRGSLTSATAVTTATAYSAAASNASTFLPSSFLPALRASSARVELKLYHRVEGGDAMATARAVKAAVAATVAVASHRVAVVEVRGGLHVVVDLIGAAVAGAMAGVGAGASARATVGVGAAGGAGVAAGSPAANANALASKLVEALLDSRSALYLTSPSAPAPSAVPITPISVDPRAGVLRLSASGAASQLLSQEQLATADRMLASSAAAAADADEAARSKAEAAAALAARVKSFTAAAVEEEEAWWGKYGSPSTSRAASLMANLSPDTMAAALSDVRTLLVTLLLLAVGLLLSMMAKRRSSLGGGGPYSPYLAAFARDDQDGEDEEQEEADDGDDNTYSASEHHEESAQVREKD